MMDQAKGGGKRGGKSKTKSRPTKDKGKGKGQELDQAAHQLTKDLVAAPLELAEQDPLWKEWPTCPEGEEDSQAHQNAIAAYRKKVQALMWEAAAKAVWAKDFLDAESYKKTEQRIAVLKRIKVSCSPTHTQLRAALADQAEATKKHAASLAQLKTLTAEVDALAERKSQLDAFVVELKELQFDSDDDAKSDAFSLGSGGIGRDVHMNEAGDAVFTDPYWSSPGPAQAPYPTQASATSPITPEMQAMQQQMLGLTKMVEGLASQCASVLRGGPPSTAHAAAPAEFKAPPVDTPHGPAASPTFSPAATGTPSGLTAEALAEIRTPARPRHFAMSPSAHTAAREYAPTVRASSDEPSPAFGKTAERGRTPVQRRAARRLAFGEAGSAEGLPEGARSRSPSKSPPLFEKQVPPLPGQQTLPGVAFRRISPHGDVPPSAAA